MEAASPLLAPALRSGQHQTDTIHDGPNRNRLRLDRYGQDEKGNMINESNQNFAAI